MRPQVRLSDLFVSTNLRPWIDHAAIASLTFFDPWPDRPTSSARRLVTIASSSKLVRGGWVSSTALMMSNSSATWRLKFYLPAH